MESAHSETALTPRAVFLPLKYLWADNETGLSRKNEKKKKVSQRNVKAFYYQAGNQSQWQTGCKAEQKSIMFSL